MDLNNLTVLSVFEKLNLLSQAIDSEDPAIQLAVESLCTMMLISGAKSSKKGKLLNIAIQIEIDKSRYSYDRYAGPQ